MAALSKLSISMRKGNIMTNTCYNRLLMLVFREPRSLYRNNLIVAALTGFIVAGGALAEPKPLDLTWAKLIPESSGGPDYTQVSPVLQIIKGLMSDEAKTPSVVASLDGRRVRLSGYVVPLKHKGIRVSEFLLVPYVGACIHVPAPPWNQIICSSSSSFSSRSRQAWLCWRMVSRSGSSILPMM